MRAHATPEIEYFQKRTRCLSAKLRPTAFERWLIQSYESQHERRSRLLLACGDGKLCEPRSQVGLVEPGKHRIGSDADIPAGDKRRLSFRVGVSERFPKRYCQRTVAVIQLVDLHTWTHNTKVPPEGMFTSIHSGGQHPCSAIHTRMVRVGGKI